MKIRFRLMTAGLFVCLALPQAARAGGDLGEAPYEIGEKLFARKNFPTALKYYKRALTLNDVRAYYRMGLIYEDAGNDREALRHYRRFIDLGQQDDAQRADAVLRLGASEERLKTKTKRTNELLERGKSLFKKGKYREAEQALLQAASRDESKPEIHFYLGEVYLRLEKYDKARSEYNKAKRYY